LDDWDRQALLSASAAGGFNEQSTEAAFKQWKERNDAREKAQFEKWKQSKQAPHVSPGGTGATETPYRDDMSVRELTKAAESSSASTRRDSTAQSPGRSSSDRLGDNMADTATTLASVLKDAWTSNRLAKQFEDAAGPLKRMEKFEGTMIGAQAQVPIYKYNAGGFTSFGAAGGSFNTYNNVGVDQAVYTLVTLGMPVSIELSAINQAGTNNAQSVISGKMLEIQAGQSELGKQAVRQLVTNGDGSSPSATRRAARRPCR
jgi:hypothetical protein